MKIPKTIYLIIVLIFILVVIILVQTLNHKKPPNPNPVIFFEDKPQKQVYLNVVRNSLTSSPITITDSFTITFSRPISTQFLSFIIEPTISLNFSLDNTGTILTVSPQQIWKFDTSYKFTIKRDTRDLEGHNLATDQILNFSTGSYGGY